MDEGDAGRDMNKKWRHRNGRWQVVVNADREKMGP